ncbi:MAG: signal peptidase I [Clostridiales bacterium]|nr:signal peptidase I [Clostridiales bacterium]
MKTRWIFKLFNAAAIALILVSVFVLLSVVLTPAGQVPQVLGYSVFRVMTGSMEPEIRENSLLVVKKTPPEDIVPGDVISFFSPDPMLEGAVNTHRVVRIEKENGRIQFITKGDANVIEDTYPVDASALVGKAVFKSYWLGKTVSLLANPLVFGIIILLPLLIILLMNLYRAVRIAADIAKKEEEEAVRKALEEIKAKQNAEHEQI